MNFDGLARAAVAQRYVSLLSLNHAAKAYSMGSDPKRRTRKVFCVHLQSAR